MDMEIKKREINRLIKKREDSQGRLLCLIPTCDKLRQKYKTNNRIRNYCEDHTYEDMGEFTHWPTLREKALKRDNFTCVCCGQKEHAPHSDLVGDHKIPIAIGGDEWDLNNIQTLCIACNKKKTSEDLKNIDKFRKQA